MPDRVWWAWRLRVDDDRCFRSQVTHSGWTVALALAATVAALAIVWWHSLSLFAEPAWTATAWHPIETDGARLTLAVETQRCSSDATFASVSVEVVERDASVTIEAQRQSDGGLISGCAPSHALKRVPVQLDAPLGDRALHGCRLAPSAQAAELGADSDSIDCRQTPAKLRSARARDGLRFST